MAGESNQSTRAGERLGNEMKPALMAHEPDPTDEIEASELGQKQLSSRPNLWGTLLCQASLES
jgi:hypothetical protein